MFSMKDIKEKEDVKVGSDEQQLWELDAENGFLSYTKMDYVSNLRHVRKVPSEKE